jgi:hypothetical protein
MSLSVKSFFTRKAVLVMLLALAAVVLAPAARAQSSDEPAPKVELYAGYAWMEPGGTVWGCLVCPAQTLNSMSKGFTIAPTYYFNKHWGLTVDGGGNFGDNATVATMMAGPQYKFRGEHVSPFMHLLMGWHQLWPHFADSHSGFGMMLGGGIDVRLSRHVDWRLIEGDYVYGRHDSPVSTTLSGARLGSGLVFKFGGGPPPPPPSCSVSAQPMEVMAGEPVNVTASGANFKPDRTLTATWTSSGGKLSGSGMGGSVDTTGLAPGSYNVGATVGDGKKASASCSGSFTVKEPPKHPPQISCSANPATVRSGESSTINCTCTSPDNRSPLTFAWSTNAGSLSGSGASEVLDTAGLPSGPVSVRTTCTDDRGLSDATTSTVNVEAPPPVPQSSKLGECDFKTARVDNKCKAVLDDVALRLQRDADSKAVIVGNAGPKEAKTMAAQRATNAKTYLVKEKGIDASRIELRTGMSGEKKADFYIVPAGATFTDANTEMVMEKAPMMKKATKKAPAK